MNRLLKLIPLLMLAASPVGATESGMMTTEVMVQLHARVYDMSGAVCRQAQEEFITPSQPMTPEQHEQVRVGIGDGQDDESHTTTLPATQIFAPLRADPKEPRFFVSVLKVNSGSRDTTIGAVGFGKNFGIVRRETRAGLDWQLGLAGAVFAQFDLEAPSSDLINADYVIGLPLTWRLS